MSGEKRPASIRIALVGKAGVGKSKILAGFAGQPFVDDYIATRGAAFQTKEYYEQDFHLTVWDTSSYANTDRRYIQSSQLTGIVLDVSDFQEEELSARIDQVRGLNPKGQIFLLVNKIDLVADNRDIDRRLKSVLRQKNLDAAIYYCSAKNNQGIEQAFISAVEKFLTPPASLLSSIISWLSQHKIWTGGNILLIASIIAMLVIATFPFGGVLALGLPLSALAVAAILGGIALAVWNVGCALVNWCNPGKPGGGGPPDQPSGSIGNFKNIAINSEDDQTFFDSPTPIIQSKAPQPGNQNNLTHQGLSLKPGNQKKDE